MGCTSIKPAVGYIIVQDMEARNERFATRFISSHIFTRIIYTSFELCGNMIM